MERNELEKKLENISSPQLPLLQHQGKQKSSIMSTRKSSRISLILMAFPFIILFGAISQSAFNILLPPWSWLVKYGSSLPLWLRIFIYVMILIILPLLAAFLNILAVTWFEYDKKQKVLNISIRLKKVNIIIIIVTTIIALLFIGHSIAEWLSGEG